MNTTVWVMLAAMKMVVPGYYLSLEECQNAAFKAQYGRANTDDDNPKPKFDMYSLGEYNSFACVPVFYETLPK